MKLKKKLKNQTIQTQNSETNLMETIVFSGDEREICGHRYKTFYRGTGEYIAFDNGAVLEVFHGHLWKTSNWQRLRKYHGRFPNSNRVITVDSNFVPVDWTPLAAKKFQVCSLSGETYLVINVCNKLLRLPEFKQTDSIENLLLDYISRLVGSKEEFQRAVRAWKSENCYKVQEREPHLLIKELRKT